MVAEASPLAEIDATEGGVEAAEAEETFEAPSLRSFGYLCWALTVGFSVTFRLWCSVQLSDATAGMDPFVLCVHVAARSNALSALCLVPFSSIRSFPRGKGPWLAGLCTLPAGATIASARVLGLGLTEMTLKLSTLSVALLMDVVGGRNQDGSLCQSLAGTAIVLAGVAEDLGIGGLGGVPRGPTALLCIVGVFAGGAGYVMQARLGASTDTTCAAELHGDISPGAEATAAFICQLVSAAGQWLILVILSWRGFGSVTDYPMSIKQAPLWAVEGLQGAAYLRSMQVLPQRVGFAVAFTLSLLGQLLTAAVMDAAQNGWAIRPTRCLSLGLVIAGAIISSASAGCGSCNGGSTGFCRGLAPTWCPSLRPEIRPKYDLL